MKEGFKRFFRTGVSIVSGLTLAGCTLFGNGVPVPNASGRPRGVLPGELSGSLPEGTATTLPPASYGGPVEGAGVSTTQPGDKGPAESNSAGSTPAAENGFVKNKRNGATFPLVPDWSGNGRRCGKIAEKFEWMDPRDPSKGVKNAQDLLSLSEALRGSSDIGHVTVRMVDGTEISVDSTKALFEIDPFSVHVGTKACLDN